MVRTQALIDEQKCFKTVHKTRWAKGTRCPHCDSEGVAKRGFHNTQKHPPAVRGSVV